MRTKVLIEMRGGCICNIYSTSREVDAFVVDHDESGIVVPFEVTPGYEFKGGEQGGK